MIIRRIHIPTIKKLLAGMLLFGCGIYVLEYKHHNDRPTEMGVIDIAGRTEDQTLHPLGIREQDDKTGTDQQVLRKRTLTKACIQSYEGDKHLQPQDYDSIYYDDKMKLLYCEIPKVACTNWKRILLLFTGKTKYTTPEEIPPHFVHNEGERYLKRLSQLSPDGIKERIRNYYKMIFVRNPYERLVSAYFNKFGVKRYYNEAFQKKAGGEIIRAIRKSPTPEALATGNDVRFEELVKFIILSSKHRRAFNPHWELYYNLCHPCHIQYDFIGKQETLNTDVDFVFKTLGISEQLQFPKPRLSAGKPHVTTNSTEEMFANVTISDKMQLYDVYSKDFKLFGY